MADGDQVGAEVILRVAEDAARELLVEDGGVGGAKWAQVGVADSAADELSTVVVTVLGWLDGWVP